LHEDNERKCINVWTDIEKCIFLDRFLQHPKDFRKIASFLRNKSVRDCIAFYYDSKQTVPYKAALKEHLLRRKRRGDAVSWEATIQAALSVGAIVTAGTSAEKPLLFTLPIDDHTYYTRHFHPLRREILESLSDESAELAPVYPTREKGKAKKLLPLGPIFTLDAPQRRYLDIASQDVDKNRSDGLSDGEGPTNRSSYVDQPPSEREDTKTVDSTPTTNQPTRKAQKWTKDEKRMFIEALEIHGKPCLPAELA